MRRVGLGSSASTPELFLAFLSTCVAQRLDEQYVMLLWGDVLNININE